MKKIISYLLIAVMLFATIAITIPASAATTVGPYTYDKGCIQNITETETKSLGNGAATYWKGSVTSLMHNEASRQNTYDTYLAVGTKDAKFFVYSGGSNLSYGKGSVADLVEAFEAENPDYEVVAAVNGDFFNTSSGEPESPMIQNYQVLKSSLLSDGEGRGRGVVGINEATGKVTYYTIGQAYKDAGYGTTYNLSNVVQVLDSNGVTPVTTYSSNLALAPSSGSVSFTTSDYGKGAYSGKTVYEVELTKYRNDKGRKNNVGYKTGYYFAEGKITKTVTGTNDMKPAEGKAYIAVFSESQAPEIKIGATVRCQNMPSGEWANVSNAIGFKQQLLAEGNLIFPGATYSRYHHSLKGGNGDISESASYYCSTCGDNGLKKEDTATWTEDCYDYPNCWKPRTAIGFKADGSCVLMVVSNGSNNSWGATYVELGTQFKALGCTDAFLLDGGTSSTMVVRDGDSLNTVYYKEAEKEVANIAILAVLKDTNVDKSELNEAIEKAGPYVGVWNCNEFTSCFNVAKNMASGSTFSQKMVDGATEALAAATEKLEILIEKGTAVSQLLMDELKSAIEKAEALKKEDYDITDEKWKELIYSIDNAKYVYEDETVDFLDVQCAIYELNALISEIEKLKKPLESEKETDESEKETDESEKETDESEKETDESDVSDFSETDSSEEKSTENETEYEEDTEADTEKDAEEETEKSKKGFNLFGCDSSVALPTLAVVGMIGAAVAVKKKED